MLPTLKISYNDADQAKAQKTKTTPMAHQTAAATTTATPTDSTAPASLPTTCKNPTLCAGPTKSPIPLVPASPGATATVAVTTQLTLPVNPECQDPCHKHRVNDLKEPKAKRIKRYIFMPSRFAALCHTVLQPREKRVICMNNTRLYRLGHDSRVKCY